MGADPAAVVMPAVAEAQAAVAPVVVEPADPAHQARAVTVVVEMAVAAMAIVEMVAEATAAAVTVDGAAVVSVQVEVRHQTVGTVPPDGTAAAATTEPVAGEMSVADLGVTIAADRAVRVEDAAAVTTAVAETIVVRALRLVQVGAESPARAPTPHAVPMSATSRWSATAERAPNRRSGGSVSTAIGHRAEAGAWTTYRGSRSTCRSTSSTARRRSASGHTHV